MSRYSPESYQKMFDLLLSEELCYSSVGASEGNIQMAIKRVLGRSIKMDCILAYSDLVVDEYLNVHFKIIDPDKDIIQIDLIYGA